MSSKSMLWLFKIDHDYLVNISIFITILHILLIFVYLKIEFNKIGVSILLNFLSNSASIPEECIVPPLLVWDGPFDAIDDIRYYK